MPDLALTLRGFFSCLGLLSQLAHAGCSGVSCDARQCPKDPPPTIQMTATCNAAHANKCSSKYDDWQSCIDKQTTCDRESQTSDSNAYKAAVMACDPKYKVYAECASAL